MVSVFIIVSDIYPLFWSSLLLFTDGLCHYHCVLHISLFCGLMVIVVYTSSLSLSSCLTCIPFLWFKGYCCLHMVFVIVSYMYPHFCGFKVTVVYTRSLSLSSCLTCMPIFCGLKVTVVYTRSLSLSSCLTCIPIFGGLKVTVVYKLSLSLSSCIPCIPFLWIEGYCCLHMVSVFIIVSYMYPHFFGLKVTVVYTRYLSLSSCLTCIPIFVVYRLLLFTQGICLYHLVLHVSPFFVG